MALMPLISGGATADAILAAIDVPGKFSLSVTTLEVTVPNAVEVRGQGIKVTYDPNYDPEKFAGAPQKLVSVDYLSLRVIPLDVTGTIAPLRDGATTIPGLVIYDNGFHIGKGTLIFKPGGTATPQAPLPANGTPPPTTPPQQVSTGQAIKFGSILEFDDLRVGVDDFDVRFDDGDVTVSGGISLGSGGVRFLPGKAVNGTIKDRLGPEPGETPPLGVNTDAVRATLVFADGKIEAFKFSADTLTITLGSVATITAVDFMLDTGASGDPDKALVSFLSVGAEVKIGSLVIGGEARNFAFMGDGSFQTRPGFGIFLSVGGATGDSFKWPTWLPIKITELGITWRDIQADPADFAIILSASIAGMPAVPGLVFSGAVEGIRIDIGKLLDGEFPITDIASIAVTIEGDLFGGQINAGLIGGIIKLSAGGTIIDTFDVLTPVAERVFFVGVQGGFTMAGIGGFQIRFAMSELGPLGVFISVNIPGGILLEPNTGLSINDFAAGVEFFKTLPSIEDPTELRRPEFNVQTVVTAENWLEDVRAQVARQYLAIKQNPSRNGFTAAFTAPMTITGSAKIYTAYASEAVFNGQIILKVSTDGKILVAGKLNFAADNISMSGKLYADLSRISRGEATVLFLADIPDQVRILTIQGKLKMGFRNPSGEEVEFTVPELPPLTPTAVIKGPAEGGSISLSELNGRGYVDIAFEAPTGHRIEESTILDFGDEFTLQQGSEPLELDRTQPPLFLRVDGATRVYRYFVLGGAVGGAITINSINDSWVAVNLDTGEKVGAPTTPELATNGNGVGVRYIDVGLAPMSGNEVDAGTVGANDFTLGGAGAGITIATRHAADADTEYQHLPLLPQRPRVHAPATSR